MIHLPPEIWRALVALEVDPDDFRALFADEVDGRGEQHHYTRSEYSNRLAFMIDGLLRLAAMPRDSTLH